MAGLAFAEGMMRWRWRTLVAIVFVLQIGVTLLLALYSGPSPVNAIYWSIVPMLVAAVAFHGVRQRLIGFALLWPLFMPAAIAAEILAHIAGTCLQ